MTARQKLTVYRIVQYVLLAAALAITILLILKGDVGTGSRVLVCAIVCIAAAGLQAHYLIHELGHLLFGLFSGFRPVSFSVACVRFSRFGKKVSFIPNAAYAGASEMYPVGETHLKGRILFYTLGGAAFNFLFAAAGILYTLGGAAFNFLFAAAGILCYLLLPASWALLFFVSLAPLNLYECVAELLPMQLPAGKTDGKFALDLMTGESGARNAFAVFRAQSLIAKGCFSEVPRSILYDVPVVREDDPAFLSLLSLRMMRAALLNEREEALSCAERLSGLLEYLPLNEAGEAASDCVCVFSYFGKEGDAASLLTAAENAKGGMAALRMEALFGRGSDSEKALAAWEKAAKKLPMQGQREWEHFLLAWAAEHGTGEQNSARIRTES